MSDLSQTEPIGNVKTTWYGKLIILYGLFLTWSIINLVCTIRNDSRVSIPALVPLLDDRCSSLHNQHRRYWFEDDSELAYWPLLGLLVHPGPFVSSLLVCTQSVLFCLSNAYTVGGGFLYDAPRRQMKIRLCSLLKWSEIWLEKREVDFQSALSDLQVSGHVLM